jgi:hypothetical protein
MQPASRFTAVSVRDTIPPMDVPAHHVYLAFNIDRDAADFKAWWAEKGRTLFAEWQRDQEPVPQSFYKAVAEMPGEWMETASRSFVPVPREVAEVIAPRLLADCVVEIGPPVDPPPECPRCGAKTTHAKLLGGRCANCSTVTVR